MPTSTFALADHNSQDVDFDLVGTTSEGCVFKVAGRPLSLPWAIVQSVKLGQFGQKGNDRVKVMLQTAIAATDGTPLLGTLSLELSVPRHAEWQSSYNENLVSFVTDLLSQTGVADALASGSMI